MVHSPNNVDGAAETARFAGLIYHSFRKMAQGESLSETEKTGLLPDEPHITKVPGTFPA